MIVKTTAGNVRGRTVREGVHAFLGIPYGGPTSGKNRFRPPTPVKPWSGVLDEFAFGPSAPQLVAGTPELLRVFGGIPEPSMSEDCLVLNVWTPSTDHSALPVMVYLHGGGHVTGSATWPVYDGAAMAERNKVVVSINHRLGILGYLELGHLLGKDYATSGVNGMLDIVLALQWVHDNIAAFGGDPGNVTIFGQSGGGSKVATLFAMPSARSLFHKAIVMSGWYSLECKQPEQAKLVTERAFGLLGVVPEDAAKVLTMPVERLVDASTTMGGIDSGLNPVVDGTFITAQPIAAVRSGVIAAKPLIVGTTRDEYSMFLPFMMQATRQDAITCLRSVFGDTVNAIIENYKAARPNTKLDDILVSVATDGFVRIPAIRLAEAQLAAGGEVFMYRFDWESPLDPSLRAAHGLDLPFVFDTPDSAYATGQADTRFAFAKEMCDAWVSFAQDGKPKLPTGIAWPQYTLTDRATILFNMPSTLAYDPAGTERKAW